MADVRPHDPVRSTPEPTTSRANALDDLVGRVLANRYRLRRIIGTGASGRVYEADDVQLGRTVAVKVLHRALADDQGFLLRFRSEARVAAALQHRNIVTVHDWGEDDTAFMVTEILEGGSLRAMLDNEIRLTPAQAARLGRDVAGALEYAHARGIVHRDVKPANLLFDEHAIVRIADFGLARALAEASWTEPAGTVFGTARYASPEQARGVALDARSDIYSLALVLFESITGTIPFAADTIIGSLALRTQQPITAPIEWGPLRAVIERAGRVEPDERYPTAASMAAALRDASDALGRPEPLRLAGLHGGPGHDPNPTAIAPTIVVAPPAIAHPSDPFPVGPLTPPVPIGESGADALTGRVIDLRDPADPTALFDQDADQPTRPTDVSAADDDESALLFDQDASGDPAVATQTHPDSVEPAPTTKRRTGRAGRAGRYIPAVVTAAVLAVLAIGAYALATMAGSPVAAVPNAIGRTETEARDLADEFGFEVRVESAVADDPAGVVIDQQPDAGSQSNGALTLIVSSGPPPVETPDLINLRRDEAELAVIDAGLVAEFERAFDEAVPRGRVVAQDPEPRSDAERDSTVTITMSQGPAPRAVPELVGQSPDAARRDLEELGFTVTTVEEFSDDVEQGDVIGTNPAAGNEAEFGSEITLLVSRGPEMIAVPNVFGEGWQAACRTIRRVGFECDVENFAENGTVQNQDPQPGDKQRRGESVTIYL